MPTKRLASKRSSPAKLAIPPQASRGAATRNERTGTNVAHVAGKVLNSLKGWRKTDPIGLRDQRAKCWVYSAFGPNAVTVGDLRALAASCLTQSPDQPSPTSSRTSRKVGRGGARKTRKGA